MRSLRIPTLVASGTDDTVVVQRTAEALKRLLPNARLLVVDRLATR
ncbi:alpha/beta fold hydrolase [Burkholderia sp. WSM2232]